jgi:endonuclease IV
MNLGAHMSIAGGMHRALERGRSIGCSAVQLFTQSTSRWRTRKLDPGEIALFREKAGMFAPNFIQAHSSYLVNLASNDARILSGSIEGFLEEMRRSSALGLKAFSFLMNDERFFDRPMVLETPKGPDDSSDIRNLALLRGLRRPSKRRKSPR